MSDGCSKHSGTNCTLSPKPATAFWSPSTNPPQCLTLGFPLQQCCLYLPVLLKQSCVKSCCTTGLVTVPLKTARSGLQYVSVNQKDKICSIQSQMWLPSAQILLQMQVKAALRITVGARTLESPLKGSWTPPPPLLSITESANSVEFL